MTGPLQALRRRLDIVPGAHRPRPLVTGMIAIALVTLLMVSSFTGGVPLLGGDSGRLVRAEFDAADQVDQRTVVRVAGVDVGRVESVEAGATPRTSVVTMRIAEDDVAVKDDARADIRWRTLLGGNMYVDLRPGSPSARPLGDRVIPASRTTGQVEWDDFNQPLDGPTAGRQQDVIEGFREGLGDPDGVGATLERLGPALDTVARGAEPVRGREPDDLRRLVAATADTLDALGRDTGALQRLVEGARTTFATTARRRQDLGSLIELTPPALDETIALMRRLRPTLDRLDPLVQELRPGARAVAPAARTARPALLQTDALLRESRPLLRDAGPALSDLAGAAREGVPLLRDLRPTVRRLRDPLLPFLRRRDEGTRLRNFEAIGPTFGALSGSSAPFDERGYYLRFAPLAGDGVTTLAPPLLDTRPPEARR